MKRLLNFLFGDLGLIIFLILLSVVIWFAFPYFTDIVKSISPFSKIVSILLGILFTGFFLSSIITSFGLIVKGLKFKKWLLLILGLSFLIYDATIILINFL